MVLYHDVGFTHGTAHGKLRLGKLIGRGAFGDVYEGTTCINGDTWQTVAVKKLKGTNITSFWIHISNITL